MYLHRSLGTEKEKKKKKKKNKNKSQDKEGETNVDQTDLSREGQKTQNVSTSDKDEETDRKSSQVRTFPNGLVVEELAMGKPDGKRASSGKQVSFKVTWFLVCQVAELRTIEVH